jgi:hypothetical protein
MSGTPLTPRTPLLTLESLRALAAIPGAALPPAMLVAMRAVLIEQGKSQLVRELEGLFDMETGRARTI